MPARTNATASTAGVLRPDEFARHVRLERSAVGAAVAPWVENHWGLGWALPAGRWFASEVLPHPTCSLTVEVGTHRRAGVPEGESVVVTGVCTPVHLGRSLTVHEIVVTDDQGRRCSTIRITNMIRERTPS